ncbi:hypothetical protein H9X85_09705 [Anaerotignum lactatifermentans]|uniref:Stage III sporulation protein AC n=1 Tax=Anaerotignum lactatifermentans TaxID=160404 RepID=A0ABS2GCH4_9FIRM|nr:hypothetical protein [Anaerotignum lactatifermentans]MBM6830079.1 hypothetical protein [Anaerotignum lactatifermentans]MBM6878322.1 hypothetical protein [Anaerotignum lactatifermentans]MBM6951477.1 hypothetical protein [Anaerotignum lactatifermentans]
MDLFMTLAGQLFLILCVQSILEVLAASRWSGNLQKVISFGCYLAALVLVLQFMQQYMDDIFRSILRIF